MSPRSFRFLEMNKTSALVLVVVGVQLILLWSGQRRDTPAPQAGATGPHHVLRGSLPPHHLDKALKGCGDVCRTDLPRTPSKFFDFVSAEVDCAALLSNAAIDAGMARPTPPPLAELSQRELDGFSYGGRVQVVQQEINNQRYHSGKAMNPKWTREMIDDWTEQCRQGRLPGSYGVTWTTQLNEALKMVVKEGDSVLVIGSEYPWAEACALSHGAARVTTLEYGEIQSLHPKVQTLTPSRMRERHAEMIGVFDAVVTYSSVEHSGLGRYGDEINPWGDRQAVARAWCMTKPGGRMAIALPWGKDKVEYNLHRIYGEVQLPHLLANWKQVWQAPPTQGWDNRLWVVEK